MSDNYRRAGRCYIERYNTIRKSYQGIITYVGGAKVKRQNKDLPTSLGINGVPFSMVNKCIAMVRSPLCIMQGATV
jgi:hypothetical protein